MITTVAQLQKAMRNPLVFSCGKATANGQGASHTSWWRSAAAATGNVGAGNIPGTTPAVCNNATTGAIPLPNATGGKSNYLGMSQISIGLGMTQLHDRLVEMGGLVGNILTVQTVNMDLSGVSSARRGRADYSDVQWFMECYTDAGSTLSTCNVNVTYDDDSTAVIPLTLAATGLGIRAGASRVINPTTQGRYIKSIQSCQLTASTGAAGNFGFTAARQYSSLSSRTFHALVSSQIVYEMDWSETGFPKFPDDVCLFMMGPNSTTSIGFNLYLHFCQG